MVWSSASITKGCLELKRKVKTRTHLWLVISTVLLNLVRSRSCINNAVVWRTIDYCIFYKDEQASPSRAREVTIPKPTGQNGVLIFWDMGHRSIESCAWVLCGFHFHQVGSLLSDADESVRLSVEKSSDNPKNCLMLLGGQICVSVNYYYAFHWGEICTSSMLGNVSKTSRNRRVGKHISQIGRNLDE